MASLNDTFVLTYTSDGSSVSLLSDELYFDTQSAENALVKARAMSKTMPFVDQSSLRFSVMTLLSYIDDVRGDAWSNGSDTARQRSHSGSSDE